MHDIIKAKMEELYAELAELAEAGPRLNEALHGSFVAGGAIVSYVLGEEPKDFDIWFRNVDYWTLATCSLARIPERESKYSTTYKLPSGKVVQFVKSRLGEPDEVVGTFDFKHCHCYYDKKTGLLKYDEELIRSKRLEFVPGNLCHPVNTVQRVLKFVRRGYSVSNESIAALMNDVGDAYVDQMDIDDTRDNNSYEGEVLQVFKASWGGGDQGSR